MDGQRLNPRGGRSAERLDGRPRGVPRLAVEDLTAGHVGGLEVHKALSPQSASKSSCVLDSVSPSRSLTPTDTRSLLLPKRSEGGAQLGREKLRLFPRGEVSAFVDLVKVNQVAIGAPCPCFRGSI